MKRPTGHTVKLILTNEGLRLDYSFSRQLVCMSVRTNRVSLDRKPFVGLLIGYRFIRFSVGQ